jgi:outer membrane protein assembly factor BamB
MSLSLYWSKKGLSLAALSLFVLCACKKNHSTPLTFKTPEAYPAQNVMPTSFTAEWEQVAAVSYLLYVALDSNFTQPLTGYNPMSVRPDSAHITGLTTKTNYYYKVRAVAPNGDTSDASNIIYIPTPDPTDDRFVYIGSKDTYLYCFYAGTGAKVWSLKTQGDIESTPNISNNILYFGGTDQRLYSVDALTGVKRWEFRTGGPVIASPTLGPGTIFISTWYTGTAFGVNANGSQKWTVKPTTGSSSLIFSSPTYSNGLVYVASEDQNIYAFDASSGTKVWSVSLGDTIISSPAVSNGIVYVGSFDKYLYALDAANGSQKWRAATSDSIGSSPTVSNGIVYVGSYDGYLYAFDATTGAQKWKAKTQGRIGSSPMVGSNGLVYVGSFDKSLYAFNATTGAPVWNTATGGRVWSSPTVSGNTVYVGSYDTKLYAMNATTGAIKWTAATTDSIRLSSPAVLTFPGNTVLPSISGDAQ